MWESLLVDWQVQTPILLDGRYSLQYLHTLRCSNIYYQSITSRQYRPRVHLSFNAFSAFALQSCTYIKGLYMHVLHGLWCFSLVLEDWIVRIGTHVTCNPSLLNQGHLA